MSGAILLLCLYELMEWTGTLHRKADFYVLLTVHLSIILVINQLDTQNLVL